MSTPRETTSHSPSPSRSSLKSHKKPSRSLIPSPRLDESHLRHTRASEEEIIQASPGQEEDDTNFEPFFTLIENPSISEHYHPTVHYIFSDDDVEILTEAACRALAQDDAQHRTIHEPQESKLPAPIDGIREHYIIIDLQPNEAASSYEVTHAQSLSSEWQVTNASISSAPTIHDSETDSSEGLMLKIEGIGTLPNMEADDLGGKKKVPLSAMVERFEKGMVEIRKMVNTENGK